MNLFPYPKVAVMGDNSDTKEKTLDGKVGASKDPLCANGGGVLIALSFKK